MSTSKAIIRAKTVLYNLFSPAESVLQQLGFMFVFLYVVCLSYKILANIWHAEMNLPTLSLN